MKKLYLGALFLSTFILTLSSCDDSKKQGAGFTPEVPVIEAIKAEVPVMVSFTGQVYSDADVGITSRIDGQVTAIHFREGHRVKKGDLLYSIDPVVYKNKTDQAEANLAEATTYLEKAKADLGRIEPLAKINAVSKRELVAAQAQVKGYEAKVDAMKALLRNAQTELSYTQITSPVNGLIGISKVRVGDYVGMMSSKNLNTVSKNDTVKFRFLVSERDYLRFVENYNNRDVADPRYADMTLTLSDGSVYSHPGKFSFADREIDPATGSLVLEAVFPNPGLVLKSGLFGRISFLLEIRSNAIVVPLAAVSEMQGIQSIQVVTDSNIVDQRVVKASHTYGNAYVIESGIEAGDHILMGGSQILRKGMKVNPKSIDWNLEATTTAPKK